MCMYTLEYGTVCVVKGCGDCELFQCWLAVTELWIVREDVMEGEGGGEEIGIGGG